MHVDIQTFPASAFGVETADFCFFLSDRFG